ncbi:MAG TPA: adenylate/guanylate cyclase domain-containing protein [Candidatus Dormibacteraeota bacterium]|nr:adenylate/guanylate cyclase domain-containing protein [Candidatus Dormibacteraeota bacterium]
MISRIRAALLPLIAIADAPGDDDDARLRKRAGVVAGYLTIVTPLGVPASVTVPAVAWVLALGFSAYSIGNLIVLWRTKRFDRYVAALIFAGTPFVLFASTLAGGVSTSSGALVWAFLAPAYALLALGPRRAMPWFFAFLGTLIVAVAIDPFIRGLVPPPPYPIQLLFTLQNIGLPLTVTFLFLRYTDLRRRTAEARSDELLTNAIPTTIATRLKHGENRIAEAYPETTVVFADIAGFTPWAGRTDPHRVVALLDDLFSRFDRRAAGLGVEKIKTVGDAYMAAAGAPQARADHAAAGLAFGQAILAEVAAWREANGIELEVRVGIASGRVVGGVIGARRIVFDLWGDTVNTAARMESSGVPGRIQLAESTRALLDGRSDLEARQVDVKGLGPMTTYLLRPAPTPPG